MRHAFRRPEQALIEPLTRPNQLVSLTTAATHPPRRGQQVRTAGILDNLGPGWRVDSYSLMIQRSDLPLPRRLHTASSTWSDHRTLDPLVLAWVAGLGRLGLPPVRASTVARLLPHRTLRRAVRRADVVMIDAPYAFEWLHGLVPSGVPVVLNAHNIESDLYRSAKPGWRRRVADEIERCEAAAFRLADLVFLPSESDARRATEIGASAIAVIPNGVGLDHFRDPAGDEGAIRVELGLPTDRRIAVFIGAGHPPNQQAVAILERHAPAFKQLGITVVIVGRCGIGRSGVDNVIHAGEVVDVVPYLHAADVAVCPLVSGSGTSFKILEFLAAGLPVVTTRVGARGLDLRDGRDIVVSEPDDFPEQVAALLTEPVRAASIAEAGRAAVRRFQWPAVGAVAASALDHLVSVGRRA